MVVNSQIITEVPEEFQSCFHIDMGSIYYDNFSSLFWCWFQ